MSSEDREHHTTKVIQSTGGCNPCFPSLTFPLFSNCQSGNSFYMQFFAVTALLTRDLFSCVDVRLNAKELLDHCIEQLLSTEHLQVQGLFVGFGSCHIPLFETLCFACPLRKEIQYHDLSANPYRKLVTVI